MAVIVIDNQKGGVGKTTITFNLSKGLAARGMRVLVIDNDPQANLTSAFLASPEALKANIITLYEQEESILEPQLVEENLYLIGSDIHVARVAEHDFEVIYKLREGLEPIKHDFDVILIDCLPSFGFLNMAALNAADYVLIPTKPAPFALSGMKDLFETISKAQKRINPDLKILGIVLNLVEGRVTTIARELEEVLRDKYGAAVFKNKIRKAVRVEESPAFNLSIMEYDPKGRLAKEFNRFIDEVIERMAA